MSRCPECGQKECCGTSLSQDLERAEARVLELEALVGTLRDIAGCYVLRNVRDVGVEQHSREIAAAIRDRFGASLDCETCAHVERISQSERRAMDAEARIAEFEEKGKAVIETFRLKRKADLDHILSFPPGPDPSSASERFEAAIAAFAAILNR